MNVQQQLPDRNLGQHQLAYRDCSGLWHHEEFTSWEAASRRKDYLAELGYHSFTIRPAYDPIREEA